MGTSALDGRRGQVHAEAIAADLHGGGRSEGDAEDGQHGGADPEGTVSDDFGDLRLAADGSRDRDDGNGVGGLAGIVGALGSGNGSGNSGGGGLLGLEGLTHDSSPVDTGYYLPAQYLYQIDL